MIQDGNSDNVVVVGKTKKPKKRKPKRKRLTPTSSNVTIGAIPFKGTTPVCGWQDCFSIKVYQLAHHYVYKFMSACPEVFL